MRRMILREEITESSDVTFDIRDYVVEEQEESAVDLMRRIRSELRKLNAMRNETREQVDKLIEEVSELKKRRTED